ncbi:hypothetical protein LAZ67_20002382 [Cordylochernes scorpioides]|uniref:Uncharacterized protein n=1 Tax=Cordylochernes scorpioides TaxID=51811 RepID=A0ABY6LKP5_9ARAC|nr:hypothetical protein LAZ67_20002382 [Cordylochernes scorpioides]
MKLRGGLQASCCLKRSDCCLPPTPVYFLEDSRRFYELLSPVLRLLSFTVLQLLCRLPPRLHGRVDIESRQDSGRQGTSKQVDHCLYRKMEQGREEESKKPMKTDPDYESGDNPTFPKKETTLDVLGRLTTTLHQLSAVTGHRERWNRYDGSYKAQSFFTNYDAQADRAQLQYSTRLRKPPNLLQAPLRVTNTRARKKSTSNLLSKIKANTKLPINTVLEIPPPTRLISRNPAWVADENVDLKEEWRNRWSNLAIANKDLVEDPNTKPPGYNLPRRTWSTLNRIRTSTGRCNYLLNKWNMSPDQNCDCGQIQTMHHILRDCPRRFFQGTLGDIHRCTEEALEWIRHLDIPL